MENLNNQLTAAVKSAFTALFEVTVDDSQIQLQKTRKEFDGDITLVVFPFLRLTKKSPEQSGEVLGSYLKENVDLVEDFNVSASEVQVSVFLN